MVQKGKFKDCLSFATWFMNPLTYYYYHVKSFNQNEFLTQTYISIVHVVTNTEC